MHALADLGLLAAIGFLLYLGAGRLRGRRQSSRRLAARRARADLSRYTHHIDGELARYGHRLTWASPDSGVLAATCAGCQGTVTVTPVRGGTETDYQPPISDGDRLVTCTGGTW